MNERIRELAEQSGWMMGDEVEGFNTRLEKFAELIVGEFLFIIDDERKSDMVNRTELWKQIKQHFGVEETKGWVCPRCGVDRTKTVCPHGYAATIEGKCPMIAVAQ